LYLTVVSTKGARFKVTCTFKGGQSRAKRSSDFNAGSMPPTLGENSENQEKEFSFGKNQKFTLKEFNLGQGTVKDKRRKLEAYKQKLLTDDGA